MYEIKLPNFVFEEKKYIARIDYVTEPLIRIVSCVVYLDFLDLDQYLCDEIYIIFTSSLKDKTLMIICNSLNQC